jgi:hypothetical protein
MKKLILVILILLSVFRGFSQIPVTDAATAALVEQIAMQDNISQFSNYAEYAQQTSTLQSTLDMIKETRELLSEVSAVVQQVIYYKDIIQTQLTIISYEIDYITDLKNDPNITTSELSTASSMFGDILVRSESLLDLALSLVTSGEEDMESSARIQLLKEIADEMSGLFLDMTIIQYEFEYISKDRALEQILLNW